MTTPSTEGRNGVVIVGSVTADVTTFSQRLPARGETILGDQFTLMLGGKGANQAVAAGRAGARTSFVGCVGDDLFHDLVVDGLTDAGVDLTHLRTVPGPTGVAHIRVDASAQNDIVMVPLANAELNTTQIDEALAAADAAHRDWSRSSTVAERAALVRRAAELHRERREELADIFVREMGKPREAALEPALIASVAAVTSMIDRKSVV